MEAILTFIASSASFVVASKIRRRPKPPPNFPETNSTFSPTTEKQLNSLQARWNTAFAQLLRLINAKASDELFKVRSD